MSEYAANLAASLRAGARLGPNEAARAVLPLAEALAAEHAHGLVRGSLDAAYVAPEVADGAEPTAATDVWSVGALLFHAMAGHAPFEHSPETPARLRSAGWLAPLVEMALAPDPADRPQMAEVAAYLRAREPASDEPEPTVVLPAPPPHPVTATGPVIAPPAPDAATPRHDRDRRTAILAMVLAAAIVVLGLITLFLVVGNHHDPSPATPPAGPQSSRTITTAPSSPEPSRTRKPRKHRSERPTAADLTSFARRYVATASSDPAAGFRMLTHGYQAASPDYREFWSAVEHPRILSIHADARAMTVSYVYAYRLNGRAKQESVTLRLVRQGRRVLIAGAS